MQLMSIGGVGKGREEEFQEPRMLVGCGFPE